MASPEELQHELEQRNIRTGVAPSRIPSAASQALLSRIMGRLADPFQSFERTGIAQRALPRTVGPLRPQLPVTRQFLERQQALNRMFDQYAPPTSGVRPPGPILSAIGRELDERVIKPSDMIAESFISLADLIPTTRFSRSRRGDPEEAARSARSSAATRGELLTGFTDETVERFRGRDPWHQVLALAATDPFVGKAIATKIPGLLGSVTRLPSFARQAAPIVGAGVREAVGSPAAIRASVGASARDFAGGAERALTGLPRPPVLTPPIPSGASALADNVIGLRPIQPTVTRAQQIRNIAADTVGKPFGLQQDFPQVTAALLERARVQPAIASNAARIGAVARTRVHDAFRPNKLGQIKSLADIDPRLPGAPTIQDIADRFPTFRPYLNDEQLAVLEMLRTEVSAPYRSLLEGVGISVARRASIDEGGFYLPRGLAEAGDDLAEALELPTRRRSAGGGRGGVRIGAEKPAPFGSMAQGIDKGWEYPEIADSVENFARQAGQRATDQHVVNYFKSITDETGKVLGQTAADRVSPLLRARVQSLRNRISGRLRTSRTQFTRGRTQVQELRPVSQRGAATAEEVGGARAAAMGGLPEAAGTGEALELSLRELDGLEREFIRLARLERGAGRRIGQTEFRFLSTREAIADLRADYAVLNDEWKSALRKAQSIPRDRAVIGELDLPALRSYAFPAELADAANAILKAQRPTMDEAKWLKLLNTANTMYRGLNATADNSAVGIHGLLGWYTSAGASREALKTNLRAWGKGGDRALGAAIRDFDAEMTRRGLPLSEDWSQATLHIGGHNTEMQLGQGFMKPVASYPMIRQANRAFGYYGDVLRLFWAAQELEDLLRRGRTLPELIAKGEMERIAKALNGATGWSEKRAFGDVGDLLLFAQRFLRSRMETVARGALGLRPGATLEQRIARRALTRMVGYGTILTVSLNELLGEETDFNPLTDDGHMNPNFVVVRYGDRDYSLFGTWASLLGMIVEVGGGHPDRAWRNMGSGLVANTWDFLTGSTAVGERTRDDWTDVGKRLLENFIPFAEEELPSIIGKGIEAGQAGDIAGAVAAPVAVGAEMIGVKSGPLSVSELRNRARSEGLIQHADELSALAESDEERELIQAGEYDPSIIGPKVRDFIKELPDVRAAQIELENQGVERQQPYAIYRKARDDINTEHDLTVARRAESLGPGREFRAELGKLNVLRANNIAGLQDRSADALDWIKELDPSQHEQDVAIRRYYEVLAEDPPLEDPFTGQYNFKERDRRLAVLATEIGEGMVNFAENWPHRNETGLQAELRRDRKALEEYFNITEDTIERVDRSIPHLDLQSAYDQYLAIPRDFDKEVFLAQPGEANAVLAELVLVQIPAAKRAYRNPTGKGVSDEVKQERADLELLLFKWEYLRSGRPLNPLAELVFGEEQAERIKAGEFTVAP